MWFLWWGVPVSFGFSEVRYPGNLETSAEAARNTHSARNDEAKFLPPANVGALAPRGTGEGIGMMRLLSCGEKGMSMEGGGGNSGTLKWEFWRGFSRMETLDIKNVSNSPFSSPSGGARNDVGRPLRRWHGRLAPLNGNGKACFWNSTTATDWNVIGFLLLLLLATNTTLWGRFSMFVYVPGRTVVLMCVGTAPQNIKRIHGTAPFNSSQLDRWKAIESYADFSFNEPFMPPLSTGECLIEFWYSAYQWCMCGGVQCAPITKCISCYFIFEQSILEIFITTMCIQSTNVRCCWTEPSTP